MNSTLYLTLIKITLISIVISGSSLLNANGVIEVSKIKFDDVGSVKDKWIRMEVEFQALKNTDSAALNPDFLDDITLTATIVYEPKPKVFTFYSSEVEIVTVELKEDKIAYFYLPGDIAKRDRLNAKPYAAYVKFQVKGEELSPTTDYLYGKIKPQQLQFFEREAESRTEETEGILLPFYDVPGYAVGKVNLDDLPTYKRFQAKSK